MALPRQLDGPAVHLNKLCLFPVSTYGADLRL